jgi:hypothetical protein
MSLAVSEAPPADQSSTITSTRYNHTRDRQPFEEELSKTEHIFEAANKNEAVQNPEVAIKENSPLQ